MKFVSLMLARVLRYVVARRRALYKWAIVMFFVLTRLPLVWFPNPAATPDSGRGAPADQWGPAKFIRS